MTDQDVVRERAISDEQKREFILASNPTGKRRWLLEHTDIGINVFTPRDQPNGRSERVEVVESAHPADTQHPDPLTKGTAMSGVDLIAAERERQVSEEGWTPEHDDGHSAGELALAAAHYALAEQERARPSSVRPAWPFPDTEPHAESRVRELTKAGALIAAEIDRLHRV